MNNDRMKAKKIPGEHCRFCGDADTPLIKTPCCNEWICCDTKFVSFRGDGRCQYDHERFSLCYSHYSDGHKEPWKTCQVCIKFWKPDDYKEYYDNSLPRFTEPA
jgi:hypothetical protein